MKRYELIVNVLSPGAINERRDREAIKLYSFQGVEEYWIVSRELQHIEVKRREDAVLKRAATPLKTPPYLSCQGLNASYNAFLDRLVQLSKRDRSA